MKLRPYQRQAKQAIRAAFASGTRSVCYCSPTGSGKTVTFADIAKESVKRGLRVMVLVDRKELLDQARNKLFEYGLNPSIISAGRRGHYNNAYIATVQTLTRRTLPSIDLLIVDEAHKQTFDKMVIKYKDFNPDLYIIGATATPYRKGKMKQMSDLYKALVNPTSIQQLIDSGHLADCRTFTAQMDMKDVKIVRGDYDITAMYDKFNKKPLYDDVVGKYTQFANGTKALCFNINIAHSKQMNDVFNAAGIPSAHIDGSTPKYQREQILELFTQGAYRVLNNCDILTTGYDEPTIETIIVNRATTSMPLWLQMGGRGSRPNPPTNKTHFKLIDMGGNVYSHGFWQDDRDYNLTHPYVVKKDGIAPVKDCKPFEIDRTGRPGCGALVHTTVRICPHCGFLFPEKERTMIDAEFSEVFAQDILPDHLKDKAKVDMSLEELEEMRVLKGYKNGWVINLIKDSENLELKDYAKLRGYSRGWVKKMKEIYKFEIETI